MAERDYVSTPVSDELDLKETILGLSTDLKELRAGKISPQDAQARAAIAKQIWNGARIYLQGQKMLERRARDTKTLVNATPDLEP